MLDTERLGGRIEHTTPETILTATAAIAPIKKFEGPYLRQY